VHRRFPERSQYRWYAYLREWKRSKDFRIQRPWKKLPWKELNISQDRVHRIIFYKESAQNTGMPVLRKLFCQLPPMTTSAPLWWSERWFLLCFWYHCFQCILYHQLRFAKCRRLQNNGVLKKPRLPLFNFIPVTSKFAIDAPHKDSRERAPRGCHEWLFQPGTAKALGKNIPDLEDKLGGCGM